MSYISTADANAIRDPHAASFSFPVHGTDHASLVPGSNPVGPALEVVLFLATSTVVSLFLCTGLASYLVH